MDNILKKHLNELAVMDRHRKMWLVLSAFVVSIVLFIIIKWDFITESHWAWLAVTVGLTLSVTWWYWTMRSIRLLINHRVEETQILHNLVVDIRDVRKHIQDYLTK
jgi:membrane-bound metal-dependent hydrolase YbcI (DUF457 family)